MNVNSFDPELLTDKEYARLMNVNKESLKKTWLEWSVSIYLGTMGNQHSNGGPRSLGVVKARNKEEAERKGSKLAKSHGLSGLIEVQLLSCSEE